MALTNSVLAEKIWLDAGNDYQQRIPNPTVNSLRRHGVRSSSPETTRT